MPDSNTNVRFELLVNGKVWNIAGMATEGVMTVSVIWVRRDVTAAWSVTKLTLRLGGLDSATNEFVHWCNKDLEVGDEITVRVLPPGEFETPLVRESGPGFSGGPRSTAGVRRPGRSRRKNSRRR